jgi:hypothetical protein
MRAAPAIVRFGHGINVLRRVMLDVACGAVLACENGMSCHFDM